MSNSSIGLRDPDAFYQALLDLHDGLDANESRLLDARLILLLANEIGDDARLREIMTEALSDARPRR